MKLSTKNVAIAVYSVALVGTCACIITGNIAGAVVSGLIVVGAIFAVSEALKVE